MNVEAMEAFIIERFEANYELLREGLGGQLAPDTRLVALNQALLYWRKLHHVAERITDTEVPVQLPNQKTPAGRTFHLEGVVDVIREGDRTILYDIKTHDPDYVRQNEDVYAMQLNLYAYVWQTLRGEDLDELAIIATAYPWAVRRAIPAGRSINALSDDERAKLDAAMQGWQPLVQLAYDAYNVEQTIAQVGAVVDQIESKQFRPPDVTTLETTWQQTGESFARRVCVNCDARFSCTSYQVYAARRNQDPDALFADTGPAHERDGWVAAQLNATPEEAYIDALLGE